MKEVNQIFKEYFFSLVEPVKQSNYRSCASISSDIIKFSEIIGFDDGAYLSQEDSRVLEINAILRNIS